MKYALVRLVDGFIIEEKENIDPNVGTKAGLKWLPIEETVAGSGPVTLDVTITIQADKVVKTQNFRQKTAEEISAEKSNLVASELGATPAGRALKQVFEGLFFLAKQNNPSLTLAQFKTGIEGLNAIPDQAFFDWIKGKL